MNEIVESGTEAAEGTPVTEPAPQSRRYQWGIRFVIGLAATLAAVAFLNYLAWCDRRGWPTLWELSWAIDGLKTFGRAIYATVPAHTPAVALVLIAVGVAYTVAITIARPVQSKEGIALAVFLVCTALTALFLRAEQFPLALIMMALVTAALVVLSRQPGDEPTPHSAYLVLLPFALGLLLRFSSLAQTPPGFAQHAAVHQDVTLQFHARYVPALVQGDTQVLRELGRAMLSNQLGVNCLLEALVYRLYGISLTTAMFAAAILGSLSIWVAYCLGTALFDPRTGVVLAFLVALSPWSISISRYGDTEHALAPFHFMFSLYLVLRAVQTHRLRWYLSGGFLVGLSFYMYSTNQILPLLAGLFFCYKLSTPGFLRRDWWKLLAFAVPFTLVFYPLQRYYLSIGRLVPVRASYVQTHFTASVFSLDHLLQMAGNAWRQLFVVVNDPWFIKPGGGLGALETALLLPGLLWLLWCLFQSARRDAAVILLIWLPLSVLPSLLAPDDSFRRLFLTAQASLVVAAAVLGVAARRFAALRLGRWTGILLAMLVLVPYVALNTHIYFERVAVGECLGWKIPYAHLARYVEQNLGRAFLYVYAPRAPDDHLRYIRLGAYRPFKELSRQGRGEADLFEVIGPADLDVLSANPRRIDGMTDVLVAWQFVETTFDAVDVRAELRRRFPDVEPEILNDRSGRPALAVWRVP